MTQEKKPFLLRKVRKGHDGVERKSWYIPDFLIEDLALIGLSFLEDKGELLAIEKPESFFEGKDYTDAYEEVAAELGYPDGDEIEFTSEFIESNSTTRH